MKPSNASGIWAAVKPYAPQIALYLGLIPLAVLMYAPRLAPLMDRRSMGHLWFAAGSVLLMFWLARLLFLRHGSRPLSWFLPAFAMGLVPGAFMAIALEDKLLPIISGFVHSPSNDDMDVFSFFERMRYFMEHHEMPPVPVSSRYSGIFSSLFIMVLGVGLIEEFSKWVCGSIRKTDNFNERIALCFFSGAGFGVAEGIAYSERIYNGSEGLWMYLARFITLVMLHAVWASLAGVCLSCRSKTEDTLKRLGIVLLHLLPVAAAHGIYNVFVTYELNLLGLATAACAVWVFFDFDLHDLRGRPAPTAAVAAVAVQYLPVADQPVIELPPADPTAETAMVPVRPRRPSPALPAHARVRRIPPPTTCHVPRPRAGGPERFKIPVTFED